MRDHGASAEPCAVGLGDSFPLPGADTFARAWAERPPDGDVMPEYPEKARTIAAAMLALGAALLLLVPVGGALLLVSGGLGLAISWEPAAGGRATAASITAAATPSAGQPPPASSIDH